MKSIRITIIGNQPGKMEKLIYCLESARDIELSAPVPNIQAALDLPAEHNQDIFLIFDSPAIVDTIQQLRRFRPGAGIIVVIAEMDEMSAQRVISALAAGAFDFIQSQETSADEFSCSLLLSKIRCCSIKLYSLSARQNEDNNVSAQTAMRTPVTIKPVKLRKFDALLIGVSTGGPEALTKLIPALPETLPVPVFIVLHMPKNFTAPMAAMLDKKSKIRVAEIVDGEMPVAGKAYMAPGGIHGSLRRDAKGRTSLCIVDSPPENGCKPSVDVLFRSAASIYAHRSLAVILTGMGNDGTKGAEEIKRQGGTIIVQDEPTSVVWGMPGSVVRAGFADEILPLDQIVKRICIFMGYAV
jgi:two-component system, chemotaxis family, protein-glutamate methylesterase/glutaminase